ncbi:hypothetical protein SEA_OBLADI_161 [Gordonia phage ObLaDi]|uniref:Uncharacterized protein n=1 Tax=Gordonia phage ObLaDi TaxID=2978487 RepID=A0A977PR52_9CAUD|nr:hypothetical protein SEA_OBLADI_161 [Gordonia phage ObLaDi]
MDGEYQLSSVTGEISLSLDLTATIEDVDEALAGQARRSIVDEAISDPGECNRLRAAWAHAALTAYAELTGAPKSEAIGVVIQDLVNDLRHLADVGGADWGLVADGTHYYEEIRGDV